MKKINVVAIVLLSLAIAIALYSISINIYVSVDYGKEINAIKDFGQGEAFVLYTKTIMNAGLIVRVLKVIFSAVITAMLTISLVYFAKRRTRFGVVFFLITIGAMLVISIIPENVSYFYLIDKISSLGDAYRSALDNVIDNVIAEVIPSLINLVLCALCVVFAITVNKFDLSKFEAESNVLARQKRLEKLEQKRAKLQEEINGLKSE